MPDFAALLTHDVLRQALAWASGGAFTLVCAASFWPRKARVDGGDYLVLYASQTGQAEDIARRSHTALIAGGVHAALLSLADVTDDMLQGASRILCVVSSTGEGDAPYEGVGFERTIMRRHLDLTRQSVAVLALGDRFYPHFCAFGHRLFDWFARCGAQALTPCLEADDLDPLVLARWDAVLRSFGAAGVDGDEGFRPWRLSERVRLNPQGEQPLYRLAFTPEDPAGLTWQAGDLAEIQTPGGHYRDYSVASLPAEGRLELFVRTVFKADGTPGDGSGLLTQGLQAGETLSLRLKPHRNFHTPEGHGPILLIGAGSGLAGLRAHILAARATGRPCRLVYGERHAVRDGALCAELRDWQAQGVLARLDLAFSRPDEGAGLYVHDVLRQQAASLGGWLGKDGAVMVCGGLAMGQDSDKALREGLSDTWMDNALAAGRYRRDLY